MVLIGRSDYRLINKDDDTDTDMGDIYADDDYMDTGMAHTVWGIFMRMMNHY